jgi:glucose-6-phosphate isomerase
MAFSMMEVVATCLYYEVNPFDQPAVEQGKKLTKEYLS